MFSPGIKRTTPSSRRNERNLGQNDSPFTPLPHNRINSFNDRSIPNRPATGTPAPWAPRLSVLARMLPASRSEKDNEVDPIKPVYVGEFPQVVRDEQASFLEKHDGDACISGGMDKDTCISWIICGNKLFIWSYLSSAASKECFVLEIPSNVMVDADGRKNSYHGSNLMLCVVNWDKSCRGSSKILQSCSSSGVLICNQKTHALIYWPDIYSAEGSTPVTYLSGTDNMEATSSPINRKIIENRQRQRIWPGSNSIGLNSLNSLVACAVPDTQHHCVALGCSSSGELWQFYCRPTGIQRSKIYQDIVGSSFRGSQNGQSAGSKGYPRSLIWHFSLQSMEDSNRQFLILTEHEIQCFNLTFRPDLNVSKLWSHEIVSPNGDLGIKKDLAGQKRIWPLDVQVDDHKVITVLVATLCKDRVSGSNYIQYSLLTMQYKSRASIPSDVNEKVLEKKAPIQVIIPKARVEDEDFLFSMRLQTGGRPSGSAVILSGDGTATVSHYYGNSPRLYQFDLPYDAGKVLDASILPSDGSEDGAWVVLTEKAGIWAIPEKAVVLGGVEPPERSLSRKGSSNEGSSEEERRSITFAATAAPRRASSEAWDAGGRQRAVVTGIAHRTAQDEESEALLGQLFHDFLLSGKVDTSFVKLQNSGAFERDGETNVFTRISKSIIDTLAKHWTTTRGAEIVALSIVSGQLMDKQQKHERYLQFLALSKCHEELCSKQRQSLQIIMEHSEKLAGMIQLRELQNMINQKHSGASGSPYSSSEAQISGALWDLILLVGEKARRNTVLLMDRENAEVFYSKVSDLEEVFNCLDRDLEYIISEEQPLEVQIHRACELSNAIVSVVRTAMLYRDEHHIWYPPLEGLTPWYCQLVVRNGLWRVASLMLQLLNETSGVNSIKSDLHNNLEMLAEVLLEAYAGAIAAKLERGEGHKGLVEEYWNRRDSLLGSLYQKLKDYVENRHQVSTIGTNEQRDEILRKLSSSLLSIAKRHEGYNTMWSICCDLNDAMLLKNLMNESMGPNGGFSYFVFKQLYQNRQFSKLLRLGEEFPEELSFFLKRHHDLLWLHEVFLHQFSSASETLHALALSQDECCISEAEEGAKPEPTCLMETPADRKRLLNLSKIAAMAAGKHVDSDSKIKRIDADLMMLKLQEEILKVLRDNGIEVYDGQQLFRPEELIEHCLKVESPEFALRAFDVFAWTSSSFRRSHRSLLEECWKKVADMDDWQKLHQASIDEGWSEEQTMQNLRDTVLFQASSRCYGPQAKTIEEGFDEVLPLRKENSDVSTSKDLDCSVEAILMQHKDFPDAGKLMLTTIVLGSLQDDDILAEDGPSAME